MKKEILRCRHLSGGEEVRSLKGFNMELYIGETLLVLGSFDSGKEYLRRLLCGQARSYGGQILIYEEPVDNVKACYDNRTIFYANPEAVLIGSQSIAENIFVFSSGRRGILPSKKVKLQKAAEMLEKLGLDISPNLKIKDLDYYSQLVICMAMAVLYNSKIILFEHLENELDAQRINKLKKLLEQEKAKGRSFLIMSEKLGDISRLADKVLLIDNGRDKLLCPAEQISEIAAAITWNKRQARAVDKKGDIIGIFSPDGIDGDSPKMYAANVLSKKHPGIAHLISHEPSLCVVENKDYNLILSRYPLSETLFLPRNKKELFWKINKKQEAIMEDEFYEKFTFLRTGEFSYSEVFFWKLAAIYRFERFHPRIMILDHPFLRLDASEEALLRNYLIDLSKRTSLVIISRNIDEIRKMTDDIIYDDKKRHYIIK